MQKKSNDIAENFGKRLKLALDLRSLSQSGLAEMLGTRQSTVGSWLKGAIPRDRTITEITVALKVARAWLINGWGEMEITDAEWTKASGELTGKFKSLSRRDVPLEVMEQLDHPSPRLAEGIDPQQAAVIDTISIYLAQLPLASDASAQWYVDEINKTVRSYAEHCRANVYQRRAEIAASLSKS